MITLVDRRTKRTIQIGEHERVKLDVLRNAGWIVKAEDKTVAVPTPPAPPIEPALPTPTTEEAGLEKDPPLPPVLEGTQSPTATPLTIGGIFEVSGEGQGSPYVEVAAENGGG